MFVNESGLYELCLQRTFHRCFLPCFGSFGQAVTEEKNLKESTNQKQELPKNHDEMCILHRGPAINASYQVSVHLAKWFQRRRFLLEINQSETRIACGGYVYSRIGTKCANLQRTFHRCFLLSFGSFDIAVSEEIFSNRPIKNKNCLWRPCMRVDQDQMCNLYRGPSVDASYQVSNHLAWWFQERTLKCDELADDGRRTPSDGKS